jgi:excisionase family DNA binding protein
MESRDQWLSLSQAARLLGVHPSTVRLWSDKGLLPVHRTQGRHRRYLRSEVEFWVEAARQRHPLEAESVVRHVVARMRIQIRESRIEAEPWYRKLDEAARLQYRESAQGLLYGLAAYLASEGRRAIGEARAIGSAYAALARRCDLTLVEAVGAFQFFRNLMLEALVAVYQEANVPTGKAWQEMLQRVHAFTDAIMLALLETAQVIEQNGRRGETPASASGVRGGA